AGCRSLEFIYATATTASSGLPAGWGDVSGRLSHIDLKAYDPATGTITVQAVSDYTYDATGRLRAQWDPRVSPALKTQYAYDTNGLLIGLTPPGEQAWTMSYAPLGTDAELGRLTQVSRTSPAGPASWTIAYDVALSGASAPTDMTPSTVATWGQTDIPTDATAIFSPDQVPSLPTSDYARAEVHYLNRDGYEVNDLLPGGELSTSERDRYGNVVRSLSARNREVALAAPSPAGRSHELDTQQTYSSDGLDLTNAIEPLHSVRLDSGEVVDARRHTQYRYDETKPAGSTIEYHLPTTTIVGAQIAGRADADAHTTTVEYDWTVRQPTRAIQDSATGGLHLTNTWQYDDTSGLMMSRHLPRSPSSDSASATKYITYTAAANPTYAACGGHPEWQYLLCESFPVAQAASVPGQTSLPWTTYTYNKLGEVTVRSTLGTGATRTNTTTYDDAGRETQRATASAVGTDVPTTTTTYDASTGQVATSSAVVDGTTRTVETDYDDIGQPTRYVDGTGQATTTTFDLLGRPVVTDDGKGTQTRSYDPVTARLTRIVDSQAGTFTATYDADGDVITKDLPNGLRATYTIDEAGQPVDLRYVKTSGCSTDCTWLHFGVTRSVLGQQRTLDSTMSQQTDSYDAAGRLTEVRDTPAGKGCTVRQYAYDLDSNRLQLTTHAPGTAGACAPTSAGQTTTHTYDSADRIIDSGFVYDPFGRVTQAPAASAGGAKLTSSYFGDDAVRSQTQAGTTNTYDLDPERRIMLRTTSSDGAGKTETSHYSDETDSPTWTATSGGHWSRNVEGIDGDLAATVDDTAGAVLQLSDLHGSVAATAATSSTKVTTTQVLEAKRTGTDWAVDPVRALVPGSYVARVRQNDASGNVGEASTHFQLTGVGHPDTAYRDGVVADGPEAYWRLGELGGVTAADETGAHPATYQGAPGLREPGALAGDPDTAVSFDGVNDDLVAADQPWRRGDFTVETWVKTSERGGVLMSQGGATDNVSWSAVVDDTAGHLGQVHATMKRGTRLLDGYNSTPIDDGRWHHVAVSFSKTGTTRVSVDGTGQSTAGTPLPTTGPAYAFGFDEGSGTVTANAGTAGGSGTVTSAPWTRSGRFGGALTFNGAPSVVTVPDSPAMRLTSSGLTVEAWIKPTTTSQLSTIVAKSANANAGWSYLLATQNAYGFNSVVGLVATDVAQPFAPPLPLNAWSHIAMTWSASELKVYANGTLMATTPHVAVPTDTGGALEIGSLLGYDFHGSIDEVKIYPRALAQTEIATDQTVPVNSATRDDPSASLGLDAGLGTVLTDSSGNGRDVTLSNSMAPGWTTGRFGSAIQFSGTNHGSLTDPGLANSPTGMTLQGWIKTSGTSAYPAIGGTGFGLYGSTGAGLGPGVCANGTCLRAPAAANGVWTHLTAVWDKTYLKLYVNGVLSGTTTVATAPSLPGGIVGIGQDTGHSGISAFTAGAVDEIRVYPRPLTAAEVTRDWSMSVAETLGGADPLLKIGRGAAGAPFDGQLDEVAVYPGILSDTQISEHYRTRSLSPTLATPVIASPADGASVADATPVLGGTGLNREGLADHVRIDVFSGTDTTQSPVQSLLGDRTGP
ncbi:MAG TPA: LamG-like jellyroll fold domain-containing protein, partial [Actinomycetes bacterium]